MISTTASISLLWICLAHLASGSPVSGSASFRLRSDYHAKRQDAGPQIDGANFPDPGIINVNGTWYSFGTRTKGSSVHIQVATSSDFNSWNMSYYQNGTQLDALPDLPSWVYAASPNTWAPDVQELDDGTFVMYFSASTIHNPTRHCVGAATSSDVMGPYTPQENPLICPLAEGGAIDAAGYDDNVQRYIVYKIDGNAIGHGGDCSNTVPPIVPTPLLLQAVNRDGVTLSSTPPTTLLNNAGISDGGSIEAPSLALISGTYVLFFSSGCFLTKNYTVNYATAQSITGLYERAERPLFVTGDFGLSAPGGMTMYKDGRHMLFHGDFGDGRALFNAVVGVEGGDE